MTHASVVAICLIAFALIAGSMERHQIALFGRELAVAVSRALRGAGWGGLLIALGVVVGDEGWGLGLVRYSGCTSLAASIVFGALIVCERVGIGRG